MSKLLDLWDELTGVVLDYALSTPPSAKWLMCYGQPLVEGDAATARLRAKLLQEDSPHGVDGSGNPLVPDARGRTTAAPDNLGGASAGRLVGATALGSALGVSSLTLTEGQMPRHSHAASSVSAGGHTHTVSGSAASAGSHTHGSIPSTVPGAGGNLSTQGGGYTGTKSEDTGSAGAHTHTVSGTAASAGSHSHTISVSETGAGDAIPVVQPTLLLNKIIRL